MRTGKIVIIVLLNFISVFVFCQVQKLVLSCQLDTSLYYSSRYFYLNKSQNGKIVQFDTLGQQYKEGVYRLDYLTQSPKGNKIGLLFYNRKESLDSMVILNQDNTIEDSSMTNENIQQIYLSDYSNYVIQGRELKFYQKKSLLKTKSLEHNFGTEYNGKYSDSGKLFVLLTFDIDGVKSSIQLFNYKGTLLAIKDILVDYKVFNRHRFLISIDENNKTIKIDSVVRTFLSKNNYKYIKTTLRYKFTDKSLVKY